MDNPKPEPLLSCVSGFRLVKKRSKMRSCSPACIPGPESVMHTPLGGLGFERHARIGNVKTRPCWTELQGVVKNIQDRSPHKAAVGTHGNLGMAVVILSKQIPDVLQ